MILNEFDNVYVDLKDGHKYALCGIKAGEKVFKYGYPIGVATSDIHKGEHVHTHNIATLLSGIEAYSYQPNFRNVIYSNDNVYFDGYRRADGTAGIRNDIWIIPTVGCVNGIAKKIGEKTGALALTHPYGCSQLGDDLIITQKVLIGLVNNPNAAGVLMLSLGCENNNIKSLKKALGNYNHERIRFLECQSEQDEIVAGIGIVNELGKYKSGFSKTKIDISEMKIGLKCGGSDGFSGITANPLLGRFCNTIVSHRGSCVMTEVPEMFGAEKILMNRCESAEVFGKLVMLINNYKEYFLSHGQPIYENPSPGNIDGGISTLEEKSLGCITKGGEAPIVDVLGYGDAITHSGLNLLDGPGNDLVACTNLAAAGCQLILFTTGRGTPLGAPVPTVKISSNSSLTQLKSGWIDFDASEMNCNSDSDFFGFVQSIISGQLTKNERNGYREIAIFKNGVTL